MLNTKEFITKAKFIHGNKYNYSKTIFIKSNIKVEIICEKHGSFYQRPNDHLRPRGCSKCKNFKGSEYYKIRSLGNGDPRPKYYVYFLIDPLTKETFYVGKGSGRRLYAHVNYVKRGKIPNDSNMKLFNKIKYLFSINKEPIHEIANDNMKEIDALSLESAFIDYYGLKNLCNYHPSGFDSVNFTKDSRRRISEATKKAMDNSIVKEKCKLGAEIANKNRWVKKHGSIDGYDNYIINYRKNKIELVNKRKLNKDIRLLRNIIKDIRKKLLKEKKLLISKSKNPPFIRNCPKCNKSIEHTSYTNMRQAIREKWTCHSCAVKVPHEINGINRWDRMINSRIKKNS